MNNQVIPGDLLKYYEANIEPQLKLLEKKRQKDVINIYKSWVLMAVGILAAILMFTFNDAIRSIPNLDNILAIGGLACFIIGIGWQLHLKKRLRSGLKQALIGPVCQYYGMEYHPKGFNFPIKKFIDNGILPYVSERTRTEDYISGTHQQVTFKLCEAQLTREVKDANDEQHTEMLFDGLLLQYSFLKPFAGDTRVLSKRHKRNLFKTGFKGEHIVLEDPRFNSMFDVYATDQIESRYILTPGFMERIIELAEHFSKSSNKLSLAFTQEQLLISIPSTKNLFEGGRLYDSFLDRSRLEQLVQELDIIRKIIDILHLNNTSRS